MKAFIVAGPESAGNRLLTAVLVRAGCAGAGSTEQPWSNGELPDGEDPAVVIRSFPHGGAWPDLAGDLARLRARGYAPQVLVTARDPASLIRSQVAKGHRASETAAFQAVAEAYGRIFAGLSDGATPFHVVPYESLVLGQAAFCRAFLPRLGLPAVTEGPLQINGCATEIIADGNAKYRDATFEGWLERSLVWLPEQGMGRYPVDPALAPYDDDYFDRYRGYAETELGRSLTRERCAIVTQFHSGELLDIGIGAGQFLVEGVATHGYDINPKAIAWLKARNLWRNPFAAPVAAISCWDSLEHLPNPAALLRRVEGWVFASLPIFRDAEHILRSRHFRRDEHLWYWSRAGLETWMRAQGFLLRWHGDIESRLGREDIESFAFERLDRGWGQDSGRQSERRTEE